MTWASPWVLWALGVPALWVVLYAATFRWKKRVLALWGEEPVVTRLLDPRSGRFQGVKAVLVVLAGGLWVVSLAGPQWGETFQNVQRRGVDVMIAVDVSASMLAEDVRPNRLTQAKRELGLVIDGLEGDRVGVVAFAGTAFLQCPLTLDYGAARTLLDLIGPDLIPTPGTSLADAMDTALGAFPAGSKKHRALVLLTDGEDHSGKLRDAEKKAVEEGVRVFPIGFGSAQGEAIPLRDASGALVGYKKDSAGQTVMSKRDDSALRSLAEKTGGTYFPATQGEVEVQRLLEAIGGMEKRSLESRVYGRFENHYRGPLWLVLFLLVLEFLISEVPGHFGRLARRALGGLAAVSLFVWPGPTVQAMGRYPTSAELSQVVEKNPTDPHAHFQQGLALYREGGYAAASQSFEKAQTLSNARDLRSVSAYNDGNAFFREGKFDQAIEKYKEALRWVPSDPDAKHNLEFAQRAKRAAARPSPSDKKSPQNARDSSGKGGGKEPTPSERHAGAVPKPGEMSKEDAERLLQAVEQQEKDARQKAASGRPPQPSAGEDW